MACRSWLANRKLLAVLGRRALFLYCLHLGDQVRSKGIELSVGLVDPESSAEICSALLGIVWPPLCIQGSRCGYFFCFQILGTRVGSVGPSQFFVGWISDLAQSCALAIAEFAFIIHYENTFVACVALHQLDIGSAVWNPVRQEAICNSFAGGFRCSSGDSSSLSDNRSLTLHPDSSSAEMMLSEPTARYLFLFMIQS